MYIHVYTRGAGVLKEVGGGGGPMGGGGGAGGAGRWIEQSSDYTCGKLHTQ